MPRRQPVPRPVRLSPRAAELAGREGLLDHLRNVLTATGPSPRLIVLHGLGGVGKTSVMVEYAHRYLDEYGLVWQFAAEDPATLSTDFAKLATQLDVWEPGDHADPVEQVHTALANRSGRWLVLLDNVTDAEALGPVLPPAGNGHILVTSRSAHWPSGYGMRVPELNRTDAQAYLIERTGDRNAAAGKLADALGGLPLALNQAVAYVRESGLTLDDYLQLLMSRRAELLRRSRPPGYPASVASTWTLAFDQLERTVPAAIALLRLLAYYAPDTIPIKLLLSRRPQPPTFDQPYIAEQVTPLLSDILAVHDATSALRRHSLISQPVKGHVSVHRLVQAVTLDQLSEDDRVAWRATAAAVVEAALPAEPSQPGNWSTYSALLPHARAALRLATRGIDMIVRFLGASGDFATARILCEQIYRDHRGRLGGEHPATLRAQAAFAKWTGEAGNPIGARDMFHALVPRLERVLGVEDPATLAARAEFADWIGRAGDPARAGPIR